MKLSISNRLQFYPGKMQTLATIQIVKCNTVWLTVYIFSLPEIEAQCSCTEKTTNYCYRLKSPMDRYRESGSDCGLIGKSLRRRARSSENRLIARRSCEITNSLPDNYFGYLMEAYTQIEMSAQWKRLAHNTMKATNSEKKKLVCPS